MTDEIITESLPSSEPTPEPIADPTPEPVAEAAPKPVAAPVAEAPSPVDEEPQESFADLLSAFERSHSHKGDPGQRQLKGVVVSLTAEQVFLDIGYKTEGVLPRSAFDRNAEAGKPGDTFSVSVTGRNEEHYYVLSRFKVAQVRDWTAIEAAFADKTAVVGTVTEVRKGGLTVDIGVPAFMPASRSGTHDEAEMQKPAPSLGQPALGEVARPANAGHRQHDQPGSDFGYPRAGSGQRLPDRVCSAAHVRKPHVALATLRAWAIGGVRDESGAAQ